MDTVMNMLTAYVGHHASWHPGQIWLLYEILGEMEHEEAPGNTLSLLTD